MQLGARVYYVDLPKLFLILPFKVVFNFILLLINCSDQSDILEYIIYIIADTFYTFLRTFYAFHSNKNKYFFIYLYRVVTASR